jgi:galactose oxidase-like protein/flagellar hook capping protein FlgD/Kelch motif protein
MRKLAGRKVLGVLCVLALGTPRIGLAGSQSYVMGNLSRLGTTSDSQASESSIAVGPYQILFQQQGKVGACTKDGQEFPLLTPGGVPANHPWLFYGLTDNLPIGTYYVDGPGPCDDPGQCPQPPAPCLQLAARDPVMAYDSAAGRFYALAWSWQHLNLLVSQTSDLRDGWYTYHIPTSECGQPDHRVDRPTLGFTADKIFISSWDWSFIRVLNKSALLAGPNQVSQQLHEVTYNGVTGTHNDIKPYDPSTAPNGYRDVEVQGDQWSIDLGWARACGDGSYSEGYCIRVRHTDLPPGIDHLDHAVFDIAKLTGDFATCQFNYWLSTSPVSLREPTDVQQMGTTQLLPAHQGQRMGIISNPSLRNVGGAPIITIGSHQQITAGVASTELRIFQIRADNGSITTNESYLKPGASCAFPAAVTDAEGNLYVGFNAAGSGEYPSCYVTARKSGQVSWDPPTLVKAGAGPLLQSDRRWGDYTGIALDGCVPGSATAYYIGQWAEQSGYRLDSWVANFRFEEFNPGLLCSALRPWHHTVASGGSPSQRWDASMIWDPVHSKLVMFGGYNANLTPPYLNDLWTFDPATNTWAQIATSNGPSQRRRHSAVYDQYLGRMLVFGGEDGSGPVPPDVWALNLTDFTWLQIPTSGGPPSARSSHVAIFDPDRNQMVIYGGNSGTLDKTWRLVFTGAGNQWIQIAQGSSPQAVEGCSAVFDWIGSRMILFGGRKYLGGQCPQPRLVDASDVYSLSLTSPVESWTLLSPGGSTPARAFASMVYDPECQSVLIYGGVQDQVCGTSCGQDMEIGISDASRLNMTGTPAWASVQLSCYGPTPRGHHSGAYVSYANSKQMYFFGGGDKAAGGGSACDPKYHNDLWRFDLPDGTPPAAITSLTGSMPVFGAGDFQWYAPGDDGNVGRAACYDFRRSTTAITEANFFTKTRVPTPAPSDPGTLESLHVTGLGNCTWYYFAVKTQDDAGNWSPISNVPYLKSVCCPKSGCPEGSPLIDVTERLTTAIRVLAPNPFAHSVVIHFTTDVPSDPEIRIFDVAGRLVRSEVLANHPAGRWMWTWDGRTNDGGDTNSGIYFVHLRVGEKVAKGRVVKLSS